MEIVTEVQTQIKLLLTPLSPVTIEYCIPSASSYMQFLLLSGNF
jgi:hypothetical protein